MLVRIVKDWDYPEGFFGQTPNADGWWNGIQFTEEKVAECDYLIVLQRPPYNIEVSCLQGNAWLILQEPPVDYFRFFTKSFPYFDRVYSYYDNAKHTYTKRMQPVLPWHLLKSYQELSAIGKAGLSEKKDAVVWVTSNKTGFPGQKARMDLREQLQSTNLPLQIYGRGFKEIYDKFDALFPAKYSVAIENFSTTDYWTEKLADSFLSWCLPFYWGAPNLEDYFPERSFIRIDVHNHANAMATMQQAINNREWEKRLDAIEEARNLVLNRYQFFPYVAKMISEENSSQTAHKARKIYRIPANPHPWFYKVVNHVKYYWRRVYDITRQVIR